MAATALPRDPRRNHRLNREVGDLVRALRGYGVLTRDRLAEVSGGDHWRAPAFDEALCAAIARGAIVRLGDELYELGPKAGGAAPPAPPPAF